MTNSRLKETQARAFIEMDPNRIGRQFSTVGKETVIQDMFVVSEAWRDAYPDAVVGVLAMRGVANPEHCPALEERKAALEGLLRGRFAGFDAAALKRVEPIPVYNAYYKRFKKTYHVQSQLESVALKEKPIPRTAALVEAMFMAELQNLLLTAGHDLDVIALPVRIDVATGEEIFFRIDEREQILKPDDMYIADDQGILSSIIYGPDYRTRITPETESVLFTVYGPPGIDKRTVYKHLGDLRKYVALISPASTVELMSVYGQGHETTALAVVDYDPNWPGLYAQEKEQILAAIGPWVSAIEHMGSTAVPGLGAKPVIDIMIGLASLDLAESCIEPLVKLGYEYVPEYEAVLPERRYFYREEGGLDNYHLHMVEAGSDFWERHLSFRDYLRTHSERARAYHRLKRELASKHGMDRQAYTDGKSSFIERTMGLARQQ